MKMSQIEEPDNLSTDMLNGVAEIAKFLGFPKRRTFYLCSNGQLRGAFQIGRSWHARKSRLREEIIRLENGGDA